MKLQNRLDPKHTHVKRWEYLSYFIGGLLVVGLSAIFQSSPGYMDADYYFMGGQQLASGAGFNDPILWNYLDDPTGLPHPANAYWMPLASVLAGAGQFVFGNTEFWAGRLIFILIAGLIPPITVGLCFQITHERRWALFAGFLALLPGFYLPYLGTTDTFGLMMVLGGLFLIVLGKIHLAPEIERVRPYLFTLILGGIAGLMHLARADGLIWFICGALGIFLIWRASRSKINQPGIQSLLIFLFLYMTGYFLLMGPWMARNFVVFGTLLSPGGARALWMTEYNELFSYPGGALSFSTWTSSGLGDILRARLSAVASNLTHTVVVQGLIVLAPLSFIGFWRLRHDLRLQIGILAWLLTFLGMTVFFPFPGVRGGLFHSGAAVQTLIWAAAPVGLAAIIEFGRDRRGWKVGQASPIFRSAVLVIIALLTVFVFNNRVIGGELTQPAWDSSNRHYLKVEETLREEVATGLGRVLVNNPAGYFIVAKRPALVIPDSGVAAIGMVAEAYGAEFLVLETNHPESLAAIYENPQGREELEYLGTIDTTHIFRISSK